MANPSLQIGNSNWAIKEDNLLGYSTAGTRFLPQPITMTRASAGTRVNSSGLVETVELLGSEQVTNGGFDTTIPIGTAGSGWAKVVSGDCTVEYDNGGVKLTQANVGSQDCKVYAQTVGGSNNLLIVGKQYKVTYEVVSNNNSTSLKYYRGGSYLDINHTVGTHTFYYEQETNQLSIFWNLTANSDITLDNVSVKESTKNNLARVDYDGTASSLLAEPERTNLITYSEDFSNADWIKSAASVVSGFTSPDGTDNAFKLVEDTSTGIHRISVDGITVVTEKYSVSIYAKSDGRNEIRVSLANYFSSGTDAYFNLDTKVITLGFLAENGLIETLSNGWFRCSFTSKNVGFAGGNAKVYIDTALNGSTSYTGDGTSGVYIYGAQLEEGSYGTSYIPTSGSTVTRVQDQYTKTGISNLINSEEGVLFLEMAALSNSGNYRLITLSDGTTSNRVFIGFRLDTGYIYYFVIVGGSTVASHITSTTSLDFSKVAVKWKANDFALWINGSEISTDTSGSSFTANTLNTLQMNEGDGSGFEFHGKVKQLQVFKTALSDSELATLTT